MNNMAQEEKELLKDLSARLTYGTIVSVTDGTIKYDAYIESISYKYIQVSPVSDSNFTPYTFYKISEIKPYLRPMSNMTEEEYEEYRNIDNRSYSCPMFCAHIPAQERIDWLNKHHFDFRNLIGRGLAIDCTNLNVY